MKKRLRITCYYCDERLVVDFKDVADTEKAHETFKQAGWILGVKIEAIDVVVFDPICHDCGRDVYRQMLEAGGGEVNAEAKAAIKELYPDLFEEELN